MSNALANRLLFLPMIILSTPSVPNLKESFGMNQKRQKKFAQAGSETSGPSLTLVLRFLVLSLH